MTFRQRSIAAALHAAIGTPEFNVAIFALMLNFPWEVLQARLFTGMSDAPYVEAINGCVQATLGDAVIMLLAYWSVAVVAGSRRWILGSTGPKLALFIAIGVSITGVIEWLATSGRWVRSWSYSASMPVVPGVDIGLVPLLQWVIVPLLVVWFVRRQLSNRGADRHG